MQIFGLIELSYAVLGLGVGLLVGMTGVGGGSLMTPLLILLFGVHPVTAVGTDLLFAAATKSVGTLVNGFNRTVEWRLVALLAAGSLPASALALFLVSKADLQAGTANEIVRILLAVALLVAAVSLVGRQRLRVLTQTRFGDASPRRAGALTVVSGAVLGVLVSLSSVGAGAVGIVALLLLYPRMPMARIVASDIAHAVPLTLLAGVGHSIMGSVSWPTLGSLLAGSAPGIVIGSYASAHVPERLLRTVLAVTLILVGVKMVL